MVLQKISGNKRFLVEIRTLEFEVSISNSDIRITLAESLLDVNRRKIARFSAIFCHCAPTSFSRSTFPDGNLPPG